MIVQLPDAKASTVDATRPTDPVRAVYTRPTPSIPDLINVVYSPSQAYPECTRHI